MNGGANVLRDDGAHGGGAASAARPARRRREQSDKEAEEEELVAGESLTTLSRSSPVYDVFILFSMLQAWKQLSRCQRNVLYTLFLLVGLIALYYFNVVSPGLAGGGGRGQVNPIIAAGLKKARNKAEKVHEVSICRSRRGAEYMFFNVDTTA